MIREFEKTAEERFLDGEIPGFVHPYTGQEAVAVGVCGALDSEDYITSTHRGHGHCLAKELTPRHMMAELYGKRDGYCNGKGGSMHIADVDAGMLGANGIVGAGTPLATGAALSIQYTGDTRIALSFCGDGAIAQGQFHEAINMAATWDLPVVIVVENNRWGEGTPVEKQHNVEDLTDTAAAYGIPGVAVDGTDVIEVWESAKDARERARDGRGPTFIEAETCRYRGHFVGDEEVYRSEDEVERWRSEKDPIDNFKDLLIDRDELTMEMFETIRSEVEETIEESVTYARNAPEPDPAEAYEDMFDEPVPEFREFADRLRAEGGSSPGDSR